METSTAARPTVPDPATGIRPTRRTTWLPAAAVVLVLAVLVRLHTQSALWLDEALTVNIASVPLRDLPAALRVDGAPPAYYLLLKGWMAIFGSGDIAVRALSSVWSLLALPLAYLAGKRLRDETTGWCALLLVAANPFSISYATEARMYAMVITLVLAGVLLLLAALRRPDPLRLTGIALLGATLALTHYWSLFLLAVVGAGLLAAARGLGPWPTPAPVRSAALRCAVALAAGGLLFLPWLPTFLFQNAHTGAPWATPPSLGAALQTVFAWTGGRTGPALLLGVLLLALLVIALFGRAVTDDGRTAVLLRLPADMVAARLATVGAGTLVLGIGVTAVLRSGYVARYSSVVLPLALLVAALGLQALPPRLRLATSAVVAVCGIGIGLSEPFSTRKTQAPVTAAAIAARLSPDDLVVYCPDQLGPAVHRLLPTGTQQVVYPSLAGPERIDWVDYAARNEAADTAAFAATVDGRARGAVWLVYAEGYRTFDRQCETLDEALQRLRGEREMVLRPRRNVGERHTVVRYGGGM